MLKKIVLSFALLVFIGWGIVVFAAKDNEKTVEGNTSYTTKNLDMKQPLSLKFAPENTAIVVIKFQKTWTRKGFFHWMIKKELSRKNTVENTLQFLDVARDKGFPVIQAPLILGKKDKEQYAKIPFVPKQSNAFEANTWKAAYTEGIYQASDLVVEGMGLFQSFFKTNGISMVAEKKQE